MLHLHEHQIDADQFEKILRYIRSGTESGANLETGGDKLGTKGYYIQPTVFSNVKVCHFEPVRVFLLGFFHEAQYLEQAWTLVKLKKLLIINIYFSKHV